jgi:hypothetical protein
MLVRVYEDPAVPTDLMARSRSRVEVILAHAGVGVVWRPCSSLHPAEPVCNAAPDSNEVVVRLVSHMAPVPPHACGVALVPEQDIGHFITLYPRCVYESADELRVGAEVVLACSLAHEIGHQFLGPQHGSLGLMQATPRLSDWRRAVHDGLVFTASESRRLRDTLVQRAAVR